MSILSCKLKGSRSLKNHPSYDCTFTELKKKRLKIAEDCTYIYAKNNYYHQKRPGRF